MELKDTLQALVKARTEVKRKDSTLANQEEHIKRVQKDLMRATKQMEEAFNDLTAFSRSVL